MKKRILALGFLTFSTFFTLVSCTNNDDFGTEINQNNTLTISFKGDNIKTYKLLEIEAVELNTGTKTTQTAQDVNAYSLSLPTGSYKITVNGTVITLSDEEVVIGGTTSVDITKTTENISIPLSIKQFSEDFIIEEVFYSQILTPEDKKYNTSKYFKITNNTDKVLYADKLIIGQSAFISNDDDKIPTPYHPDQAFAVKAVMVLPGSGTDYPVQPGDFIVVADNAIDHRVNASTAFDLSKADFEFPSTNPKLASVDNPAVPNANVIFTTATYNLLIMHSAGVESYVIGRFPENENSQTFLEKYKYNYEYLDQAGNIKKVSVYEIPNTWILDGLNNGAKGSFYQLILGSSIDTGWTGIGSGYNSLDRMGKSVRRKILGQTENGKNIYKDTNNSTVDFERDSEPSLKNGIVH